MQISTGTILVLARANRVALEAVSLYENSGALILVKSVLCQAQKLTCDKASPERAVMLHLRGCHASKAAILTVPAPRVPVENRSPA